MRKAIKVLPFIPFLMHLISIVFIFHSVRWELYIGITILLGMVGLGISCNQKVIKGVGILSLLIFTVWMFQVGTTDYIPMFSAKMACIYVVYFGVIYILKSKFSR